MSAIVVPTGMLRISKDGEQDRVIYPVHADGWRQLGWTVHAPEPEPDEDEAPDPQPLPVALGEADPPPDDGGGPTPVPVAGIAVADLNSMTKAAIVAAIDEHYGVKLNEGDTRAELLAAAEAVIAGADGSDADGTAEASTAEAEVPDLLI